MTYSPRLILIMLVALGLIMVSMRYSNAESTTQSVEHNTTHSIQADTASGKSSHTTTRNTTDSLGDTLSLLNEYKTLLRDSSQNKRTQRKPSRCSEKTTSVVYKVNMQAARKDTLTLFLTLDACISGFDSMFVQYLIQEKIPATLFITSRWIRNNPRAASILAQHSDIFDIQNHGTRHRPASVYGCTCYGIAGTSNAKELLSEVHGGAKAITQLTGMFPVLFRPGTAFSDDISVEILNNLGVWTIGYSIAGDDGGVLSQAQVKQRLIKAQDGDIILLHMNTHKTDSFLGFKTAYEALKQQHSCILFEKLSTHTDSFAYYGNSKPTLRAGKYRRLRRGPSAGSDTLKQIVPVPFEYLPTHQTDATLPLRSTLPLVVTTAPHHP